MRATLHFINQEQLELLFSKGVVRSVMDESCMSIKRVSVLWASTVVFGTAALVFMELCLQRHTIESTTVF